MGIDIFPMFLPPPINLLSSVILYPCSSLAVKTVLKEPTTTVLLLFLLNVMIEQNKYVSLPDCIQNLIFYSCSIPFPYSICLHPFHSLEQSRDKSLLARQYRFFPSLHLFPLTFIPTSSFCSQYNLFVIISSL